jgi:alginate O-acetyltransferase complex protein AlgI
VYVVVRLTVDTTYLLLIASLIFYAKGGGWLTWLILGSIAFNYQLAIAVDRARRLDESRARRLLAAAVVVNLGILGIFKYANFFADNVNTVARAVGGSGFVVPSVVLPIGISFFTFHAISYVVDVYRHDAVAQKSIGHAALYLLLFPQLIAGPIIRYRDIADQLVRRNVSLDIFADGVRRFIIGLGKKMLIANTVALPADQIFALPTGQLTASLAWLALVCYTAQIYFDFSGYSDMAIGLGRMFGFTFPENFRWPYIATSIQDFWRRWHISLSSWFRDYLYVPLGGSRLGPVRTYVNLVLVFFLCGLWHGASWNFVVWGLFHGTFLILERLAVMRWLADRPEWRIVRHSYVMLVVMVGWVFFRADSLTDALSFLEAMAGLSAAVPALPATWYLTPEVWLALAAAIIGSMPIASLLASLNRRRMRAPRLTVFDAATVAALTLILWASMAQVAARSYNPFIYFRF